ncbi:TraB/GumN family protein [Ruminococcus flavefaciens]|uniref:TraB/GumN family protein n=1 Tax=Ruminococcus flavefaciens TaxID=1265 RepID=UPI0026E9FC2A|nr:TraB/GumN family protein [Ruminococcus flavefaciens]
MRKRGFFAALMAALVALSAVSCDNELHVDESQKTSGVQDTTSAEGEKGTESAEKNTDANDLNSYITVKESKPALWKVTDPNNGNSLYMFGMVYFMTDNTLPLPDYVMDAYKNSDSVAVEFDMSNMTQDMESMQEFYSHMVYTDGTSITDHISEETYNKAKEYLSKYFFYNNMMDGYSASFWASQVNAVAVGNVRNILMETLDSRFVTMAKMENKKVISLADADSQLKAMDATSDELADFMISDTIRRAENVSGFTKNLADQYDNWAKGDVDPLAEELYWLDRSSDLDDDYEDYLEATLYPKNEAITSKVEEFLADGENPFIIVNITSFAGEKSVDRALSAEGYKVERVD